MKPNYNYQSNCENATEVQKEKVSYMELFWIFMIGNVFGVIFEGVWCLLTKGVWETHTVSIWGPFCLIYGIGFAGIYYAYKKMKGKSKLKQFLVIALVADVVEYLCSVLLDYCLGMKAWDYSNNFLNINGRITVSMTFVWGFGGLLFIRYVAPEIEKMFANNKFRFEKIICGALSVFMAVNLIATSLCIMRWSDRHFGFKSNTSLAMLIDEIYPNERMQKIFVEWEFFNENDLLK